jgi:cell division septation protein DedD
MYLLIPRASLEPVIFSLQHAESPAPEQAAENIGDEAAANGVAKDDDAATEAAVPAAAKPKVQPAPTIVDAPKSMSKSPAKARPSPTIKPGKWQARKEDVSEVPTTLH